MSAPQSLHLIKLCVGVATVDDLRTRLEKRWMTLGELVHTTRQFPKRAADILGGGSLYWVMKGQITCRQRLLDIRQYKDETGQNACDLVLDLDLVPVEPRRRAPFQGWRYLEGSDVPPDLTRPNTAGIPPELARELAELGLL